MEKGLTQIYWGNGKGKTTAALGTALRACGSGLKVHLVQFIKDSSSAEIKSLENIPHFTHKQFPTQWINGEPTQEQIKKVSEAFQHLQNSLREDHDIIIADEILYAVQLKLLKEEQVIELIKSKPENIELILTGSHQPLPKIFAEVDLITEIKKHKHPFDKGIKARKGIEY
ncbi:MAG: cob(I)yrinic acid a,c-diamide adenosyltransferase [Nanoarchaeota archaeon]